MREFTSDYLDRTRRGMWSEGLEGFEAVPLEELDLVLDAGCGNGSLTRALRRVSPAEVVGFDYDPGLLSSVSPPAVRGDVLGLPFVDDAFDAVVWQALLVNLETPDEAVEEFVRTARSYLVSVEPDNSEARVESSVEDESDVAARTRDLYLEGVPSDVALGADAARLLEEGGADVVSTERYDHELVLEPPYSEEDVRAVERKATGEAFEERRGEMAGDVDQLDRLRADWRRVGREAARQMEEGEYRRRDVVPFYVVVAEI